MTARTVLRLAVPGLSDAVTRLAAQGEITRLPAAEWLAARGQGSPADADRWREWLLADCGLGADVLQRFAAGPCAAVAGGPVGSACWARAEPVHLATAIDHLQLAAPAPLPLDPAESASLLETLNGHLAGTGFTLRAGAAGGWLCECPPGLDFASVEPSRAIGRNLRDYLPAGRDASRVRSLINELQMLLHEHPVNVRRAARGSPQINSVWLWGAGTAGTPQARPHGLLLTDDPWVEGLWRLHGGRSRPLDGFPASLAHERAEACVAVIGAGGRVGDRHALCALDAGILAKARSLLGAALVSRLLLHAGSRVFDVPARARWRFWRRVRPLAEVLA